MQRCDPLAGEPMPIALGQVLFAGRAPDGTVLVFDALSIPPPAGETWSNYRYRLFISEGSVLRRHAVHGITSPTTYDVYRDVSFDVGGRFIQNESEGTVLSWGAAEECERRLPASCSAKLTPVPTEELARFSVENIAGGFALEAAVLPNDVRFFVVAPHVDALPNEWRIFYGPPTRVQERKLNPPTPNEYGGYRSFTFDVDGTAVTQEMTIFHDEQRLLHHKSSAEIFAGLTVTCL